MYFDGMEPSHDGEHHAWPPGRPVDAAILKAVVRGERAVEDLKTTRLWINARRTEGADDPVPHAVCSSDLAEGIVNLKDDPLALEELANAIVAVSGLLSFEDEHADRLISCVWDLALGGHLEDSTIALADAVRNRLCGPVPESA